MKDRNKSMDVELVEEMKVMKVALLSETIRF